MRTNILNRKLTLLVLVIVVLIAACQAAPAPTDTPAAQATAAPPEVSPAPLANTSASTIQVSGAVRASVEADNFYIAPVTNDAETVIGTMLYLNRADNHIVFIRFPRNAPPGEYSITGGYTDGFDGTATTGNYIDQTRDAATQYAATGGTLTLTATGSAYSGSYTFTAQDDQTGLTVTVSGTFAGIEP